MGEDLEIYKSTCLHYCNKLINEVKNDQEEINNYFGGELCKTYGYVMEQLSTKLKNVHTKIRNL